MQKIKWQYHLIFLTVLITISVFLFYQQEKDNKNIKQEINKIEIINNEEEPKIEETKIEKFQENKILEKEIITKKLEEIVTTTDIQKTEEQSIPFSATIKIADNNYQINFAKENITLEELMNKLQKESNFIYHTIDYGSMGKFVDEINGIKNDNKQGKYWVYYLNGVSAKAGISIQKINSQDNIEWKYENSTF
ncbi:MAG: DUF4430 domain-containing protein [Patescibacteria group bacterium]|nr:DUF4430 domain-containing protein [Patescibacteria group bacterium]